MDNQPQQPKMHPNAPPPTKEGEGGYTPPPPDPKGDLEAVAALMGSTAALSKEIGESIVGEGSPSQIQQFDAHSALKKHMQVTGTPVQPQPQPVQPVQPVLPVQPVQPEPQ